MGHDGKQKIYKIDKNAELVGHPPKLLYEEECSDFMISDMVRK